MDNITKFTKNSTALFLRQSKGGVLMARNRYLDDEEEVVKLNAGLLKRLFRYMIPYKQLFFAG